MSENLRKLFLQANPVTSKSGAAFRVSFLFEEIAEAHGIEAAREMFETWAKPPTQSDINRLKGWRLIERYDTMEVGNVRALSRQIHDENSKLGADEQLTPRFRPTRETIEAYLRELLRDRRKAARDGTWTGPLPPKLFWKKDLTEEDFDDL